MNELQIIPMKIYRVYGTHHRDDARVPTRDLGVVGGRTRRQAEGVAERLFENYDWDLGRERVQ